MTLEERGIILNMWQTQCLFFNPYIHIQDYRGCGKTFLSFVARAENAVAVRKKTYTRLHYYMDPDLSTEVHRRDWNRAFVKFCCKYYKELSVTLSLDNSTFIIKEHSKQRKLLSILLGGHCDTLALQ